MFEVSLASAFVAGILSFVSPCILPLVPVYISFMTNKAALRTENIKLSERLFIFLNSLFFVLGFSLIFIILGSTATFIGRILRDYSNIISRVGGGLLIIFGLNYIGFRTADTCTAAHGAFIYNQTGFTHFFLQKFGILLLR